MFRYKSYIDMQISEIIQNLYVVLNCKIQYQTKFLLQTDQLSLTSGKYFNIIK